MRCLSFLVLLFWIGSAHAHKLSDSYLSIRALEGGRLEGQWDIALRDLDHAVGIDVNGDTSITWGELKVRQGAIVGYALSRLSLHSGEGTTSSCPTQFERLLVDEHVDGRYAVLRFSATCPSPATPLTIGYSLLFDLDPDHRGLISVRGLGITRTASLSAAQPTVVVGLREAGVFDELRTFVADGFVHILHGYDHILFLLTLLFPAVVVHRDGRWQPRTSLRDSLLDVVGVVSAFTLAHSITLAMGVFGLVQLPSRLVESTIAATVMLGALNNLFPVVTRRRWLVAFGFGLVHGLGFASVLADFGLQGRSLAVGLTGFNLGVELGQLAIVLVFVPLAFALRNTLLYRRVLLPAGSAAIGGIAFFWFGARAFGAW